MTTMQYESLPQRPLRARRQHKRQLAEVDDAVGGGGEGERGGGDAATAATLNASTDRKESRSSPCSKEGEKAAATATAAASLSPRGPREDARTKRGREDEEGEGDGERGIGNVDGAPPHSTSTSTSSLSRTRAVPGFDFEYLDHTADIQIHSWGSSLEHAFSSAGLGMLNYMTPLDGISSKTLTHHYSASGHDLDTLLFSFLDEILFAFSIDGFVARELEIVGGKIDRENYKLEAVGKGEKFDRERHASGTEVKAITYSAMRILEHGEAQQDGSRETDVWVIVDI